MKSVLMVSLVSFVAVIVLGTPCFAKIDPETAVGIYLFDDEKADEIEDHSGKGHNGVFVGGNGKWGDGKFGSAIDPREGWVNLGTADDLHPVDEWTVVAWFNVENIPDVANGIAAKWDEYLLRVDRSGEGGNLTVHVKPGGNWSPRGIGGVPETDVWTHAALVWNNNEGGALKVYKDGVMIDQQLRPGKIAAGELNLCIGSENSGRGIFQGFIDEVGIFNVALEEEDIVLIMEKGLQIAVFGGAAVEPQNGLAATWGELKIRADR